MFINEIKNVKVGQCDDPKSFLSSVIDENAFNDITGKFNNKNKRIY
jgi:hypothetical protein